MGLKKANKILGYSFWGIAVLRVILLILLAILLEKKFSTYSSVYLIIGTIQVIFGIASIIMMILNRKLQSGLVLCYFLPILGIVFEFIVPNITNFYTGIISCIIYTLAGWLIKKKNIEEIKEKDKTIKKTEWFYGEK